MKKKYHRKENDVENMDTLADIYDNLKSGANFDELIDKKK